MSKLPRDIDGVTLVKRLSKFNYKIIRQKGSHIHLISDYHDENHKITIPDHYPLKIGTLNNILKIFLIISK